MYTSGGSEQGIFDLAGNVWEWCRNKLDHLNRNAAGRSSTRVLRGGSWLYPLDSARATFRFHDRADLRFSSYGFRIVSAPLSNGGGASS